MVCEYVRKYSTLIELLVIIVILAIIFLIDNQIRYILIKGEKTVLTFNVD